MFSEMKKEIIEAGILLDRYELVSLTCGNLSVRMPTGEILVTPSGMMYEKMVEDDMIVMDIDGNVIEGTRKPSSDTPAILHIFRERPDIKAVIHTHQPYATAVSLIPGLTEFRVCITALANAAGGNVPITPYSAAGSIDMGIDTIKYVGNGHAVILSQHGVMTVGKDLNQALYAAVCGAGRALGYVCAPSMFQRVAARCADQTSDIAVYQTNRDLLFNGLTSMGYHCVKPDGAFYLFPQTLEADDRAFSERAKKYDLLVVPGADFGAPGHMRISYCVKTETIERALPLFERLAKEYR